MKIIFIIGIVQAFFIEFLLLNKKKKNLSDKILAAWMFVLGVHLFLYYLYHQEVYYTYPHILGSIEIFPLLHGPLLLLYVQSLIKPNPSFKKKDLLHFVPAFSYLMFLLQPILTLSGPEKLVYVFEEIENNPPLYIIFYSFLLHISGVVYVIWSLIVLRIHTKNIKNNFSYTEKINLGWLVKLIIGMAIIWTVVLVQDSDDYIYVAATLFVFVIGFYGSRQGAIFTDNAPSSTTNERGKYEKSSLTTEQSSAHLQSLKSLMDQEKPYLESKITLKEISDRLEIHPNHLSQVINEELKVNFYDFINGYRVEEFKKRLTEDTTKKFTLLAHAYDSGYSSKSSFNEVFKKFTGMTPSQYQQALNR